MYDQPAKQSINLRDKFRLFSEHWQPRIVAELNDYQFKIARLKGEFVWHDHPDTDEAFFVLEGHLRIDLPAGGGVLRGVEGAGTVGSAGSGSTGTGGTGSTGSTGSIGSVGASGGGGGGGCRAGDPDGLPAVLIAVLLAAFGVRRRRRTA